jgi:signal transduction histidine kinase/DNA-binding response OmpR family regulator
MATIMDSNQLIILVAELCFALVCVRALWAYLRGQDPVERDVSLVFLAPTHFFVVDIIRRLLGDVPLVVSNIAVLGLLLQPFLTLRLAGRLRRVPRWLTAAALGAILLPAWPLLAAPRPLSPMLLLALTAVFVTTELVAAGYFAQEARRRTGPSSSRLAVAAWATALFAASGATLFASPAGGPAVSTFARVLALLSAVGYLVAFLPPAWLRRAWAAKARDAANRHMLGSTVTATAEDVWRRYAEVVRRLVGIEAVAVLMRPPAAHGTAPAATLAQPAYGGFAGVPPAGCSGADLDELLSAHPPVRLLSPRAPAPRLRSHYADQVACTYVSAHPLTVPPDGHGALLLFHDHRSLFADDDLRLLADLGGQAGMLAERGAVIAEQRRLADELEATVIALRAASQAKSDFLASMSHELRTPLNSIIGFSDLMRGEPTVDGQRTVPPDWVDHIHSSGRHLLGLINDVLDLAKVEAGRLDLHPEPLRLDTAADELITSLHPLLGGKGLGVDLDVPALVANADPIRFRQMLENLLSNAIKFTPAGGRIAVTGSSEGTNVMITVADTGIGIAPADHERVFEEFRQVGDPLQRKAGTGLGLALTRRLAQAHGGDIQLDSQLGQGSRFAIRLPIAAPALVPGRAGANGRADRRACGQVLLIEDDVRSAELLRTYLLEAGYDVEVAGTGETGIAAARRKPPDAVLLDVVLPGIHGWEVLRQFKADARLAAVPVFLCTVVDERRTGQALGADGFFVKPIEHGELLGALARHVIPAGEPKAASVLVVEPDDDARSRVERSLRAAGATVVTCPDGRRGLELSRRQRFDLIVCDLQAPDLDGIALLAALRENPVTRHTPVLAMTPRGEDADGGPVVLGKVHGTAAEGSAAWESLMALTGGLPLVTASKGNGTPDGGLAP